MTTPHGPGPYLALLANAFVWGLAWWPLRELQARGLHPVWATALFFLVGLLVIGTVRPQGWSLLRARPRLWALALATGATNAAFNWGVAIGDVVRVVLLFYLMPLWAVLLARWMLHEPLTPAAGVRVVLALAGAALVLWPAQPQGGEAVLFQGLPDLLGLAGGLGFALTNVLLRQQAAEPAAARALAMFCGGVLVPGLLGLVLWSQERVPALPAWDAAWGLGAAAMGLLFVGSNLALQAGAARLPVQVASLVMLSEVPFAALSSVALGAAQLTPQVLGGGALILAAALLASRDAGR